MRIAFFLILSSLLWAQTPSVTEILDRAEEAQTYDSFQTNGTMETTRPNFGLRSSSFLFRQRENKDLLFEFNSPAERGQKFLRLDEKIYIYSPDSEDLLLLQGPALQQSLNGSAVSYEDVSDERNYSEQYDAKFLEDEVVNGVDCWQLELQAKAEFRRTVTYPGQILWIGKEDYLVRRGNYLSRTKTVLRTMEVKETAVVNDRLIPVVLVFDDELQEGVETVLTFSNVKLGEELPNSLFSLSNLGF